MPVFANIECDEEEWYFETSSTAGTQSPIKSVNKRATVGVAFRLGPDIAKSEQKYAWINFCRWTPDPLHGMEEHVDDTYQLYFSKYGVAVGKSWNSIFIPGGSTTTEPVLIYDYDSTCYTFCDRSHFLSKWQAWTVFESVFGVEPHPLAEPAPDGAFVSVSEYMSIHLEEQVFESSRPEFYN